MAASKTRGEPITSTVDGVVDAEKDTEPQQIDNALKQFIEQYKLQQIQEKLLSEGITTSFLLSLSSEAEIDEIGKELTSNKIQQKKFKHAVHELQELQKKEKNEILAEGKVEEKEESTKHKIFEGVWKKRDYDNFENYLIDEGYGWLKRAAAMKIDSTITIVQMDENIIKMNVKNSMDILFQEDVEHGNAINPFVADGKTYKVKGGTGHIIEKTSKWNHDKTKVISTSHDLNTGRKIVYEIYIDDNKEFCLKRTNENNISTIFHFVRVKNNHDGLVIMLVIHFLFHNCKYLRFSCKIISK